MIQKGYPAYGHGTHLGREDAVEALKLAQVAAFTAGDRQAPALLRLQFGHQRAWPDGMIASWQDLNGQWAVAGWKAAQLTPLSPPAIPS
jgi:hypothetical protein